MAVKAQQSRQVAAQEVPGSQIKHIIRGVSNYSNIGEGVFTPEEVEMYLGSFLSDGWKIRNIFNGGTKKSPSTPSEIFTFIYILER